MRLCAHNAEHPIPDAADPRRMHCGNACKVAAYRSREAAKRTTAENALRSVTSAIYFGDADALARAVHASARLLAAA